MSKCTEWNGAVNRFGNPYRYVDSKQVMVRREVYEENFGSLKPSENVYTICQNPKCINPEHLSKRKKQRLDVEIEQQTREPIIIRIDDYLTIEEYHAAGGRHNNEATHMYFKIKQADLASRAAREKERFAYPQMTREEYNAFIERAKKNEERDKLWSELSEAEQERRDHLVDERGGIYREYPNGERMYY